MTDKNLVKIPIAINSNEVKREFLLAEKTSTGSFIIRSIPAFTYGYGLGDEIEVINESAGQVSLVKRANNIVIRLFKRGSLNIDIVDDFVNEIESKGGVYEIGTNAKSENESSLLLVSFPLTYGFRNIEKDMKVFNSDDYNWEYGNIYDENGDPIGWWKN